MFKKEVDLKEKNILIVYASEKKSPHVPISSYREQGKRLTEHICSYWRDCPNPGFSLRVIKENNVNMLDPAVFGGFQCIIFMTWGAWSDAQYVADRYYPGKSVILYTNTDVRDGCLEGVRIIHKYDPKALEKIADIIFSS
jgi:hypothetical protein